MLISDELSRILMTPRPPSWAIQSVRARAGSPKNLSPPAVSRATMARVMTPMEALEILPYSICRSAACSSTQASMAFRSLVSISRRSLSSAILKTMVRMSLCSSFRSRIRDSSSGPISDTVVRSWVPFSP